MTLEEFRFHEHDRRMREDRPRYGAWAKTEEYRYPLICGHEGWTIGESYGYCPTCQEMRQRAEGPARRVS